MVDVATTGNVVLSLSPKDHGLTSVSNFCSNWIMDGLFLIALRSSEEELLIMRTLGVNVSYNKRLFTDTAA